MRDDLDRGDGVRVRQAREPGPESFRESLREDGAFEALLIYAGSALSLFTGLAVASLYLLSRRHIEGTGDPATRFRTPGYPVTPAIFLLLILISFVQSLRERPLPTGAALVTIVAGIGIYFLSRRLGWLRDPES